FVLLLLDYWPLRRWQWANGNGQRSTATKLIAEKIPLFALSAASSVVTIWAQRPTISSLGGLPFSWRVENAIMSLLIYLRQLVWPTDLALFYPHPHGEQNLVLVLVAAAGIAAVTVLSVFLRKTAPYFFVGWFWYAGMLVPMLGLMQVGLQGHADRYTFLPHIG